ncbi:MAG: class I SAM-dependent methyltransferase [Phycisphaerae bacterium]|nr:class I SAM-dependent methyltransferase [Planctomycetota bacterium]MBL7107183.1 class I SAM-dependent methyltransferase [Phycisphaerae bacterium]
MKRANSNLSKRVEARVAIANNPMEWWERDSGLKLLKEIGLKYGQRVLDFGCRVGHYTIPAAEVVGNDGIVYAVDKEQQALNELEQKASHLNLKNIRTINTSGQIQIDLENDSIDTVLFYDVLHYHEKKEREKLYVEAYRVLKQDGLFSVYPKHTLEDDPIQEFRRLSVSDVKQEIEDSNFVFEKKHCGLISHDDGLNQGCILNFRKSQGEE